MCVEYKGGKCEICGYNKCLAALDFHHLDPSQKEKEITRWRMCNYKYHDELFTELDKCILVCANCHRELHWDRDANLNLLEADKHIPFISE
jgi:predicted HNH restriction endonuclease